MPAFAAQSGPAARRSGRTEDRKVEYQTPVVAVVEAPERADPTGRRRARHGHRAGLVDLGPVDLGPVDPGAVDLKHAGRDPAAQTCVGWQTVEPDAGLDLAREQEWLSQPALPVGFADYPVPAAAGTEAVVEGHPRRRRPAPAVVVPQPFAPDAVPTLAAPADAGQAVSGPAAEPAGQPVLQPSARQAEMQRTPEPIRAYLAAKRDLPAANGPVRRFSASRGRSRGRADCRPVPDTTRSVARFQTCVSDQTLFTCYRRLLAISVYLLSAQRHSALLNKREWFSTDQCSKRRLVTVPSVIMLGTTRPRRGSPQTTVPFLACLQPNIRVSDACNCFAACT